MHTSRRITQALLSVTALLLMASAGLAADPGLPFPATSEINDQKAGSILFYNIYTSSTANPGAQNTRFNITNTSDQFAAFVHLFFVEGATCSVADRYVCLTANQTTTFLASEQDPGTTGYVVAVDTVGAGFHERVLVVAGSSARLAQGMKDVPVDAAIVGVIDTVDVK